MPKDAGLVDLGFAEARVPAGTHICQIFSDGEERSDALFRFLLSGIAGEECCACFSDNVNEDLFMQYLASQGRSISADRPHCLTFSGATQAYFLEDRFDPERMLQGLKRYYDKSLAEGYRAARVIGEMAPKIKQLHGGSRLLEYESRVSLLLRDCPITTVCQYDACLFDGATIMDVLKVHPMMVVNGSVVTNPFYIAPETYLRS